MRRSLVAIAIAVSLAVPAAAEKFKASSDGPKGKYEVQGDVSRDGELYVVKLVVSNLTTEEVIAAPKVSFTARQPAETTSSVGETLVKTRLEVDEKTGVGTATVLVTQGQEVVFAPKISFNAARN